MGSDSALIIEDDTTFLLSPSRPTGNRGGILGGSMGPEMARILYLSFAFFWIFLSFNGLQGLESSIQKDPRLGYWSVASIYISLTAMTIPAPSIVAALGVRISMFVGSLSYVGFMIANLWPSWASLIITGSLLGFGAAILWTAQGVYLTELAGRHARQLSQAPEASMGYFNGVFYGIFQGNALIGNIASALILRFTKGDSLHTLFYVFIAVASVGALLILFLKSAGGGSPQNLGSLPASSSSSSSSSSDVNLVHHQDNGNFHQSEISRNTSSSGSMAMLTDPLFPEAHPAKTGHMGSRGASGSVDGSDVIVVHDAQYDRKHRQEGLMMATLGLLADRRMLLLVPITIYSGLALGVLWGTVTADIVSVSLGKDWVGFALSVFYAADALFSFLFGPLSDRIGRLPVMIVGSLAQGLCGLVYLLWKVKPEGYIAVLVPMFVFAIGDAAWNTQICALLGTFFPEKSEAAFANFKMWQSMGVAVPLLIGPYASLHAKVFIMLGSNAFGIIAVIFLAKLVPEEFLPGSSAKGKGKGN